MILQFFETHEPTELVGLISILAREFRTLGLCMQAAQQHHLAQVFKTHRIWPKLQTPYTYAIQQLSYSKILKTLSQLSRLDLMAKGLETGDPWGELHAWTLHLWQKP